VTSDEAISRYMVLLAGEQKLMIMRPYQIYAVQHMVKCIEENNGNGFIWHTTGSGKTLTSFKASTLLKENDHIHKCVFVVDRKDLDRQTREEFNRFQEGCVEENTNTAALVRRLLSDDYADKVIVTTIQKLGLALDENSKRNKQRSKNGQATFKEQLESLKDKRMVFIFDECHRSQFGENHRAIKEFFPLAQLFGFTGTPIFEENATPAEDCGHTSLHAHHPRTFSRSNSTPTPSPMPSRTEMSCASMWITSSQPPQERRRTPSASSATVPTATSALPGKARYRRSHSFGKHDAATAGRRFNAILATASINDAIEYHAPVSFHPSGKSRPPIPLSSP
jgi:type I restriction enzyme R subunit